ncbi:MAG TPA: hypothetical protein DEO84_00615, partial [candidate division Zixibacteria bacterium]|nr:hypothetical protein [candidate division Zixibacteria bacterium]
MARFWGLFYMHNLGRALANLWHLALSVPMAVDKNVGGQAVIEGVMMKSPEKVSTSVRLPNGRIVTKTESFISLTKRYKLFGKPIIRGILSFFEMLVLGIKTLNYSAEMATSDPKTVQDHVDTPRSGRANLAIALAVVISLGAGLAIFFFLPILLTQLLAVNRKAVGFNLVAGAIRVIMFIIYVW